MQEFKRALEVDRKDLLFHTNKKKKRTVIAPLVITFSPANPKFKDWIAEDLPILHEEPRLKKLIPKNDVVTGRHLILQRRQFEVEIGRPRVMTAPLPSLQEITSYIIRTVSLVDEWKMVK